MDSSSSKNERFCEFYHFNFCEFYHHFLQVISTFLCTQTVKRPKKCPLNLTNPSCKSMFQNWWEINQIKERTMTFTAFRNVNTGLGLGREYNLIGRRTSKSDFAGWSNMSQSLTLTFDKNFTCLHSVIQCLKEVTIDI